MTHARGISAPTLTSQESLLLALAQRYLHNILPANLTKSMAGFFDQARGNLNEDKASREREWLNKVRIVSKLRSNSPLGLPACTRFTTA